jgi:hypothetical protein
MHFLSPHPTCHDPRLRAIQVIVRTGDASVAKRYREPRGIVQNPTGWPARLRFASARQVKLTWHAVALAKAAVAGHDTLKGARR